MIMKTKISSTFFLSETNLKYKVLKNRVQQIIFINVSLFLREIANKIKIYILIRIYLLYSTYDGNVLKDIQVTLSFYTRERHVF